MKTNNYYPLTWVDYPVLYKELDNGTIQYVIDMEVANITIICNKMGGIISVERNGDKDQDKWLYLSLKRFKWKIAWKNHFKKDE